jgi:K(+)-stimulated pyrophosphate-energized sodium pump
MISSLFWIVPVAALTALLFAWIFYRNMKAEEEGNRQDERDSCLCQGRRNGLPETPVQCCYEGFHNPGRTFINSGIFWNSEPLCPIAFLTGGFFSGLCGYLGMRTATYASNRTAWAASKSLNKGLKVALRSGAVMGLCCCRFRSA